MSRSGSRQTPKVSIQKPAIQSPQEDRDWKDVQKFVRLIPGEPDPNLGRVREIREEIARGRYLQPEMIDEVAARLAIRLTQGESLT